MKRRTSENNSVNPRIKTVNRILTFARMIRRNGDTEEGNEASQIEEQLLKRLAELEKGQMAKAA